MRDLNDARRYRRVEKAIQYLRDRAPGQPKLDEVASQVHLSPFQFQREFSDWVGLSPAQFSRVLTREYLQARLDGSSPLLDLAHTANLSSVSRLHDLCVTMDAMTPDQTRRGGAGVSIQYGLGDSPFGPAILAQTERGICHLRFFNDSAHALAELAQEWPAATLHRNDAAITAIFQQLFESSASAPKKPIRLWVRGTNFQVQVWRALMAIPSGELRSYGQLAQAIDKPQSARAVGTAIGRNPVAVLVPCHRVIQASGALGGYRWGVARKAALIAGEHSSIAIDSAQTVGV